MISNMPTAKELLGNMVEGCGLPLPADYALLGTDEGRRQFALQTIESILSRPYGTMNSAEEVLNYICKQFYTFDYAAPDAATMSLMPEPRTPFDNAAQMQSLTAEQRLLVEALRLAAQLAPYLADKLPFDLALLGIDPSDCQPALAEEDYFSVRNDRLADFIHHTPHRHLAARVALCMMQAKTMQAAAAGNYVLQDYLANAHTPGGAPWYAGTHMDPEVVVAETTLLLCQASRHEQTAAARYGMAGGLLVVYDLLAGTLRERFDEELAGMARQLLAAAEQPAASAAERTARFMERLEQLADEHSYCLSDMSRRYLSTYISNWDND